MHSRRGEGSGWMWEKTLDIIFGLMIALVIVFIAFTVWKALTGTDKSAFNQYEVMGDLLQGMVEGPDNSKREMSIAGDLFKSRDNFKGTVLGITSDGKLTIPIPPARWFSGTVGVNTQEMNENVKFSELPKHVQTECENKACLCYSAGYLVSAERLRGTLGLIEECKSFKVPEGKEHIILDFETLQNWEYQGETLPVLSFTRGSCTPRTNINFNTNYNPATTICIYSSIA